MASLDSTPKGCSFQLALNGSRIVWRLSSESSSSRNLELSTRMLQCCSVPLHPAHYRIMCAEISGDSYEGACAVASQDHSHGDINQR